MSAPRFLADDRGVSTAVSYTLAIGITVVLVGSLMYSMGGLMDARSAGAVDSEIRVVAEGVATDLVKVDRIAERADHNGTMMSRLDGPDRIAGELYTIAIAQACADGDGPCVEVTAGDRAYTVPVNVTADIADGSVTGGTLWIVAEDGEIYLVRERPS